MKEKDKKKKFSILKLLSKVFFSPLIIWALAYYFLKDAQKATLMTLYLITLNALLHIIYNVFVMIISSLTFSITTLIYRLVETLTSIIFICVYWMIYIAIFGRVFNI